MTPSVDPVAQEERTSGEAQGRIGRLVREGLKRDLEKQLSDVEAIVVARVEKVSTESLNELRQRLKEAKASFLVVKNSLCRLIFRELGLKELEKALEGTCGVAPIGAEVPSTLRLLTNFSKEHEGFVLKAGAFQGQILQAKDLTLLGELPSREVLLSQLAGTLQAPLRNLGRVLQAPLRSLAGVLQAILGKKEK